MLVHELLDRRPVGPKQNKVRFAIFECEYCGSLNERQLSNGKRDLSCGCVRYKLTSESNTIHGDSNSSAEYHHLFGLWAGMRDRCNRKASQDYKYYGAKGVVVEPIWDDYLEFKKWSLLNGYVPHQKLQIDRRDGDLNYCPSNCRWVTPKVNQRNRDLVLLNEEKALEIRKLLANNVAVSEIAKMYGVHRDTIGDIKRNKTWKECQPQKSTGNG